MRKSLIFALLVFICLALVLFFVAYFSGADVTTMNGAGQIAQQQSRLFLIVTFLMLIVVIPALVLTFVFSWHYSENEKAKYSPEWTHSHLLEGIWWGIPCAIIVVIAVFTWIYAHRLDPWKPIVSKTPPLSVQVVALQWKWLFIYPEQQIATVNYMRVPENTPISFELSADAPMNSFWVPQLGGQVFAMPAMRTKLQLIANKIGEYRGSSSNISGGGFAHMVFHVQATSQEDFDSWVESTRTSPSALTFDEYRSLATPGIVKEPALYRLDAPNLFDWIVMKYMMPPSRPE